MREDTLELGSPQVVDDVVLRPIARRRIARFDDGDVEGVLARLTPVGG